MFEVSVVHVAPPSPVVITVPPAPTAKQVESVGQLMLLSVLLVPELRLLQLELL